MSLIQLSFSGVLKHFRLLLTNKLLLRYKKLLSQKKAKNYQEFFFFSTSLKRDKSWAKVLIWWKKFFWSNQRNGTNINENIFPPKNELLSAKLSISGILMHFLWIWTKSFSMRYKTWRSQEVSKNYPEGFIIFNGFERVKSWGKFLIWWKKFFSQTSETGQIFPETVLLLNMIHI